VSPIFGQKKGGGGCTLLMGLIHLPNLLVKVFIDN
jgi:hypothetical protein